MDKKIPTWTRTRFGRDKVHWVAYDDQPGTPGVVVIEQGYAASLVEADVAARAALAEAGHYRARRSSRGFGRPAPRPRVADDAADSPPAPRSKPKPSRPAWTPPRAYLYTRHVDPDDERPIVAAHLILRKTARRVYVSRATCGPDQIGTEDERWGENEPAVSLDRAELEREGSAFAKSFRQSEFYASRDAAAGDAGGGPHPAFDELRIGPPCTVEEIKAAYRLRAFAAHPDRGGAPGQFRAVEAAYRRLLREAQAPDA